MGDRRRGQLAPTAGDRRGPTVRLGERFGQASLERRLDSLASVVPEIAAVRPSSPGSCAPLRQICDAP